MPASKVTLTLPDELLAVVDRFVENHPGATRSGVCAGALRDWLRAEQEAQVANYYTTRSGEERADDEGWAAIAATSVSQLWP